MPVKVISIEDAGRFFADEVSKAITEGAKAGLYSAAQRMVQHIQTEIIPNTVPQPVDRGTYKAGWKASPTVDGAMYENRVPHAGPIERGVRPQNVKAGRKLVRSIKEWVIRKGIATPQKAERVAWAIVTSMASSVRIKKGGTVRVVAGGGRGIFNGGKGLRVLERANKDLPDIVREEVAREVERAVMR